MSGVRRGDYMFSEAEILRIKSDNALEDELAATKDRHPCVVLHDDEYDPSRASDAERAIHPEDDW